MEATIRMACRSCKSNAKTVTVLDMEGYRKTGQSTSADTRVPTHICIVTQNATNSANDWCIALSKHIWIQSHPDGTSLRKKQIVAKAVHFRKGRPSSPRPVVEEGDEKRPRQNVTVVYSKQSANVNELVSDLWCWKACPRISTPWAWWTVHELLEGGTFMEVGKQATQIHQVEKIHLKSPVPKLNHNACINAMLVLLAAV